MLAHWAFASVATEGAPLAVELGNPADQVRTGGAGRYLIFHVENSDALTIVDVVAGKALKPIPAPGDFRYAADREKLFLVLNNQHVLQRWDLATQTREKSVLLDTDRAIHVAAMGSSGDGPLALWSAGKVEFWDVAALKPLTVHGDVIDQRGGVQLWPSADGLSFCAYGWTTGPFQLMRLSHVTATSAECTKVSTPDSHDYNESWAMPTADGEYLTRYNAGLYSHDMAVLEPGPLKGSALFPTEDPRFLIALRSRDKKKEFQAAIVAVVDRRILYTVQHLEPVMGGQISTVQGRFKSEPRVRYLPKEKLIITIPDSNDEVVIRHFDLERALKSTGADYLYVISKPRTRMHEGDAFTYNIETLSNSTALKYKLETAPDGMQISPQGKITWTPRSAITSGKADVIVSISNGGGMEIMHAFQVTIAKQPPAVAVASSSPASNGGKPAVAPGIVTKLTGTWQATPELDDVKLKSILKSQGVTSEQMDANVSDARKAMQGYTITYTFNTNGSAEVTSGTPADYHTLKGTWSAEMESGASWRIVFEAEHRPPEELHGSFDGPDRLAMKVPGHDESPVKSPVVFTRVLVKSSASN
jgi:hypothetical protein